MIISYDPDFYPFYKKLNVRIKNQFDKCIELFEKNPSDKGLKNHSLHDEWDGYRSIHIGDRKNDYCAIFKEIDDGGETIVYFVAIGTHKELFGKKVRTD